VSAGESHTVAIRSDGTLWAWGYNRNGRLGIGNTSNQFAPVEVCTVVPDCTDTWIDVSAGGNSTGAVRSDNTLWAWGQAANGHIGTGYDTVDKPMPTQIGTEVDWDKVTLSELHLSALKTDGSLWGTGNNVYGSLGTGTFTGDSGNSGTVVTGMVQIGADTNWTSINAGSGHMVALKSDNSLWTWGQGWKGPLGYTTANTATPTRLGTDTWLSATGGFQFSLGVKSDGTLWTWGANNNGVLGRGISPNTASILTPGQVGTDVNWARVSTGAVSSGASVMKSVTDATWSWSNHNGAGTEWYDTPQTLVFP
jgi:alpha-tubulin suppressor-like RCC1 family protein